MNHHPMQLIALTDTKLLCIFSDPFYRNKNISGDNVPTFRSIKSHDIGIGIVFQIRLIDVQQVRIGTKNKVQFAYTCKASIANRIGNPLTDFLLFLKCKIDVFGKKNEYRVKP